MSVLCNGVATLLGTDVKIHLSADSFTCWVSFIFHCNFFVKEKRNAFLPNLCYSVVDTNWDSTG